MRIINYPERIKESASELRSRLSQSIKPKVRLRLEILLWLKTSQVSTMKEACALKGLGSRQGNNLWRQYKQKGLDDFLDMYKKQGRYSPLSGKVELEKKLREEGFSTIKEAQHWILETYGLEYTENGLGNYFRANKIKLKTGRPHHPNQDAEKRAAYKKNTKAS